MYEPTIATRARIISAAERALANDGLEVPLARINSAAGQRNKSSLQYHFKNRAGLLTAIVEKHRPGIEEERQRMLDAAEGRGMDLQAVVEALVVPLANKLDDPDGGVYYLRIMAQDRGRAKRALPNEVPLREGTRRALDLLGALGPRLPDEEARARLILVFGLLFHSLSDFSWRFPVARRPREYARERRVFVRTLVRAIVAIIDGPPDEA